MTRSAAPTISTAQPEDFFQLLKPRVMSLVIFTAVTGLVVARGDIGWLSAATSPVTAVKITSDITRGFCSWKKSSG